MGRRWHFFFAWLFVINGLAYVAYSLWSPHALRDLMPTAPDWRGIAWSTVDHAECYASDCRERKDELRMLSSLFVDDPSSNRIEHYDSFLTVLGRELIVVRQHEHTCRQFRHLHFPAPSELQYFLFPATRIHLVQRDPLQVGG
jgi:hypothetical protein